VGERPPFGGLAFPLHMTDEAVEEDDGCPLDGEVPRLIVVV